MYSAFGSILPVAVFLISSRATAADTLSFNRDVRPILSENCFKCHGPDANARKSKLRLDEREDALKNRGGYFAIAPGNAEESEVVLRIQNSDPKEHMPPLDSGKSLTEPQKEVLTRWIAEGAVYEPHWAYLPPKRESLPEVSQPEWGTNPIDRFVLARLEAEGLAPAPEVEPARLLRRVSFDLIGLPPTAAELDAYQWAPAGERYALAVDRLLSSPHYGERMAMGWLDVVRYADTTGYHSDDARDMSPYRDYVIAAFNDNKPFDEFTIEQIAGDQFLKPTTEQQIASGYNRLNQITSEGGAQPKEYLAKYMADRVRNLGSVWMGATLGCAECHDHKFDPITTRNFYQFGAFFADIDEVGKYDHGGNAYAPVIYFPTREQKKALAKFEKQRAEIEREEAGSDEEKKSKRERLKKLDGEIREYNLSVRSTLVAKTVEPREIRVLPRGNWMDATGDVIAPATPEFLPPLKAAGPRATRMDLARWLVDPANPLTARAFVNRLWAQFFGQGLAPVADDLGRQGRWPSHPELLDWLAVEFMDSGWDVKHLVRLIVTSSTYKQSTQRGDDALARDSSNLLLAGQRPRRLEAELVRDNALTIAGLLDTEVGGPSARPYQPEGYYKDTYQSVGVPHTYEADTGAMQYRRGMYSFWKRTYPHPMLLAFDAPTREECTATRTTSNTPQQALTLLNDPSYLEAARVFAARIMEYGGETPESRVAFAAKRTLSRPPTATEQTLLGDLYSRQLNEYRAAPADAEALLSIGQWGAPENLDHAELAAWTQVARVLLNTQEAITRY